MVNQSSAPVSNDRRAYRVAEAARLLSLSERETWRQISIGRLAPIARIGRVVLIPSTTIDRFLERNLAPV
jgi:excisionase family DNA binding protein